MKKPVRTAKAALVPRRRTSGDARSPGMGNPTRADRIAGRDGGRAKHRVLDQPPLYSQPLPVPKTSAHQSTTKQKQSASRRQAGYSPLASVWNGEDAELLERMLAFYPRESPKQILDATVNGGRFWRGSDRPVVGMDIEVKHRPGIVGDNTCMPFHDRFFDVVVYDPPHIPNQGKDKTKDFNTRFGLVVRSSKENAYSFSHTYPPFLREAYRVLKPEGILLCKITDYIHDHRYQWAHVDLIRAASGVGFCPCDCIVKVRQGPIIDPKWKTAHHTRRQHCYWLVLRKSEKCELSSIAPMQAHAAPTASPECGLGCPDRVGAQ